MMSDTTGQILEMLQIAGRTVSGAALGATLGLSRTAVWKHIQKLKGHGYDIRASAKGYRLADSPDTLSRWDFPGREDRIHHYPKIASTMDAARNLARAGCPAFTVVTADQQTAGRGRLQRLWQSDVGGLYFTMVLRPLLPPLMAPQVNLCASLVLALTLNRLFEIPARVKWPNDILVNDAKLAGMLSEMEAESDRLAFINVGIGLNVNNDPSSAAPAAVSLKQILNRRVARKTILAAYLDALETRLQTLEGSNIVAEWKSCNATIGRRVRIVTQRDTAEGLAVDVDENGSLILQLDEGSFKTVVYGDCFHV